jgi:hypothetical protein
MKQQIEEERQQTEATARTNDFTPKLKVMKNMILTSD